ncbi:MAG: hypothetical protein NTY38_02985 [Acidobacteria bacterium]|nr:hypothetical protein [Acidobacteriota bacterium]
MNASVWAGLGLTLIAGVMAGNCMLPMKFVQKWKWENIWLVFTLASLLVFPWALGFARGGDILALYGSLPLSAFAAPVLFGLSWGVAQVLFGLSVARLGMALGVAIVIGMGSLLGTLVPLFFQHLSVLGTGRGGLILAGLAAMLAGIVVSARAGRLREAPAAGGRPSNYRSALLMAIVCGFLAPMLNYSFAFAEAIGQAAVKSGVAPVDAAYAIWPVALTAGMVPNLLYSLYLLNRNGTWKLFRVEARAAWLSLGMAVLWMGAMSLYGTAAAMLGELGTSVGWALFQIFIIMSANLSGLVTGEWKSAPAKAKGLLWWGLSLLAVATVVIAITNRG